MESQQGEYYIQGATVRDPKVYIQVDGQFTPAQAMNFALEIIDSVKNQVTIQTNRKNWGKRPLTGTKVTR